MPTKSKNDGVDKSVIDTCEKIYKDKLVNLANEIPIQFDIEAIYKAKERLNSGKNVSKKTLVKMLHQLQYVTIEYRSLVSSFDYYANEIKQLTDRHKMLACPRS